MGSLNKFLLGLVCTQASLLASPEYLADLRNSLNAYSSLETLKEQLQFSQEDIEERGKLELFTFVDSGFWKGGYCEGDPLDPYCGNTFGRMNYKGLSVSSLYVCFLECIAPHVYNKNVLEIGPGHGGWSKAILSKYPKSLICVDSLSAEHNCFWEYVGRRNNVRYIQIFDFSLSEIPNNSIDYVFSFGVFCHISPLLIQEYLKNLYPKLRKGAKCFISYADYVKYAEDYYRKYQSINPYIGADDELLIYQQPPEPVRWYHLGKNRAQQILEQIGYINISVDINVNERDPVMYFTKP